MISGSKTGNCVFVFLNDTQMLLTYVIIMSRGVVLKNEVGERTQKTSHFGKLTHFAAAEMAHPGGGVARVGALPGWGPLETILLASS